MEDLACLFPSQVGVAGAGGPAGKVVLGAGVRAHDFQDLAAGQLRHGLLGFEQRQRTGVAATVKGPVGGEFSHVLHSLTWWWVIIVAAKQPVFYENSYKQSAFSKDRGLPEGDPNAGWAQTRRIFKGTARRAPTGFEYRSLRATGLRPTENSKLKTLQSSGLQNNSRVMAVSSRRRGVRRR